VHTVLLYTGTKRERVRIVDGTVESTFVFLKERESVPGGAVRVRDSAGGVGVAVDGVGLCVG
jgi:hypothetical protein